MPTAYRLTNHTCRFCNGRVLRPAGKLTWATRWLCANCEQHVDGLSSQGLCWCGAGYQDASGEYELRCGVAPPAHVYPVEEVWHLHRPIGLKRIILKRKR